MAVEFSLVYKITHDGQQSDAGTVVLSNNILKFTSRACEVTRTSKYTYVIIKINKKHLDERESLDEKIKQAIVVTHPFNEESLSTIKWSLMVDCEGNFAGIEKLLEAPKLFLNFRRNTNLFGIDQIVGSNVKTIRITNCHKIESNILGLCALINRGITVQFATRGMNTPRWIELLQEFQQHKLSISAFQTLLLKNGLKQFAKY
jgi:hypothetical protein